MAPNAIAPAVSATRASDDEILGLAPNAVRKTNRMVATKLPGDLNRMDAFFYSRRPEDHAELARAVARLDPQSFASLARAMTELANAPAAKTNAAEGSAANPVAAFHQSPRQADVAKMDQARATAASAIPGLNAAQPDFFQATNSATLHSVMEAIESQVDRLLPEGIAKSARNRVAGEIYRELDTTSQGNRTLRRQMGDAFRSGAWMTRTAKRMSDADRLNL